MKKIITFILLIFILSIGFVSASDNTTNNLSEINLDESANDEIIGDDKYSEIYVNTNYESDGDGLSPETAYNNLDYEKYDKLADSGIIHLAEGNYEVLDYWGNYSVVGAGDKTVITSCWFQSTTYDASNININFINLTFNIPSKREVQNTIWIKPGISYETAHEYYSISIDGPNFKFTNCTFINSSIVAGQYMNSINYQNPIMQSTIKSFENCKFLNYSYNNTVKEYYKKIGLESIRNIEYESPNLITAYQYTKFILNNCIFNNIISESIVDSNGGLMGTNGVYSEVIIGDSSFSNCSVIGIVKTRQDAKITGCTYDFNATTDKTEGSPFYVNKTDIPLNETKLTINTKDNNVILTLTDVNNGKPISGVEVGIYDNGKVFDYRDTDVNGQIILNDLVGTFNFEFSYPGDLYAYHPTSVNKTFTFKAKVNTVFAVKNINTVYNTAKKWTFTLKDVNNNVLANKKVTVKLDKSYEVTTNNKGQAILTLPANLIPKTYTATITFDGDNNYNKVFTTAKVVVSKATPKLTTKKLTTKVKVKTKKITATLKGVPKNTKITLKIKGKTYTAKTNKKGIATFKVTKLNKKGTFKGIVKFAGNKYFKAVSKSVQIKVK